MKAGYLKKRLIVRGVMGLVTIGIVTMVLVVMTFLNDGLEEDSRKLKSRISQLQASKVKSKIARQEHLEAQAIIDKLSGPKAPLQGLSISSAKKVIMQLKEQFGIIDLDASFKRPVLHENEFLITQTIDVYVSDVQISLESITDKEVFAFMRALIHEMPGYVDVVQVSMNKTNNLVSEDFLASIANGNPIEGISARIYLKWYGTQARQSESDEQKDKG
tara:strand:- start:252 stop:905 length:654 start_codon:yes stop_codon:yes gene_type:complete